MIQADLIVIFVNMWVETIVLEKVKYIVIYNERGFLYYLWSQ